MRYLKLIPIFLFALALSTQVNASTKPAKNKKTAESVYAFTKEMKTFDDKVLREEMSNLSITEKIKLVKMALKDAKQSEINGSEKPSPGLYILAILIPPIAVGIHTDWGKPTLYNLLWTVCGDLPGIIHAFIVLGR